MEVEIKIAQVQTYSVSLIGLTKTQLSDLIETLTFVNDRLPDSMLPVAQVLLRELREMNRRGDIYRVVDVD